MQQAVPATNPEPRCAGPLKGLRFIEFAGIGPLPMCAMMLADQGADVLRIDRIEPSGLGIARPTRFDFTSRGRSSVALDLKAGDGIACALDLIAGADGLIEGFRPGTMERLGLGPDECWLRNPRLVYGRLTGWGQDGPLAHAAGHDLNYIALSGALHAIGRAGQPPTPPLNLVGDYAGGSMTLAFGMVCALIEARSSGKGQVVDAGMSDGAISLLTGLYGLHAAGLHGAERGTNLLDSGAPHYEVYRCADGLWVSVAPIEEKFRRQLIDRLGLDPATFPDVNDPANWPAARKLLEDVFASRTRAEWCALLEGSDACFAPVLSLAEAPDHPHNRQRESFLTIDGSIQPAPAPRFSRTPQARPNPPKAPGEDSREALGRWGLGADRIDQLIADGTVRQL